MEESGLEGRGVDVSSLDSLFDAAINPSYLLIGGKDKECYRGLSNSDVVVEMGTDYIAAPYRIGGN